MFAKLIPSELHGLGYSSYFISLFVFLRLLGVLLSSEMVQLC
jgi:hypothetical protein